MFFVHVRKLINKYKSTLSAHFIHRKCLSRIEHIDMERQTIIVHSRGINAPFSLKFDEIIKDEALLSSFSARHASYIGYYYGIHNDNSTKDTNTKGYFQCFTDNPSNKYTIRGLDRHRNVVYMDQVNKNQITRSPDQIMGVSDIVNNFPPLQACYIGILAGINHAKLQKKPSQPRELILV
jgi:hypothetical protein